MGLPIIWALIYIVPPLFESTHYKTDGEWVKVRSGAVIYSEAGEQDIATPLKAGDSVRVLGYWRAKFDASCLVETASGVRGELQMWMLDVPLLVSGLKYSGDTVMLNSPKKFTTYKDRQIVARDQKITGTLPNGETTDDLWGSDFYPDIPDVFKLKLDANNGFTKLMSKRKYERLAEELDFKNAESRIGPMSTLCRNGKNEIISSYRTFVFDPENGKFFKPLITFSPDSVAVSIDLIEARDRSDWLLSILPGAEWVYDLPITTFFARSDIYDGLINPKGLISTVATVWFWIRWVFSALGSLLWLFCFGYIVLWLLNFIIANYPSVFRKVSNKGMMVVYFIVFACFYYYWILTTLAWGMLWFLIIVDIIVAAGIYSLYTIPLSNEVPHTRCPKCREFGSIYLITKKFVNSSTYQRHGTQTETTGIKVRRWVNYTQVTQGTRSWRENVRHFEETTVHQRHKHYEDTIKRDLYDEKYRCLNCGYEEERLNTHHTWLGRRDTGTTTSTHRKVEER